MSTKPKSHQIEVTCDGCGFSEVLESVGDKTQQIATIKKSEKWFKITRKVLDLDHGQIVELAVDACCVECTPVAARKTTLPEPEPAPIDGIDLDTLRQQR